MNAIHSECCLSVHTTLKDTYIIKEILSTSKLSIVYLTEHVQTGEHQVIKEFFPSEIALRDLDNKTIIYRSPSKKQQFEELKDNFIHEAQILEQVNHKNIVEYVTHFEENNSVYIVMTLHKGTPMDKYLLDYQLNTRVQLFDTIFLPIIDALCYLHNKGIIHRDIKPNNIIIDKEGSPRLLDFGSAIYYETTINPTIYTTAGYSPIEQYSNQSEQGIYTDIFSLAATIYYSMTNIVPLDISQRVNDDQLVNIRNYNKNVSIVMAKIIKWCLIVEPQKRCSSLKWVEMAILIEKFKQKMQNYLARYNNK